MGIKITMQAGNRPAMWLYGPIGSDFGGISADSFRQELAEIPKGQEFDLHIHSEGGSFWDGVTIHNQLSQRKGKVAVVVDGLAASAASLIAMAGSTIEMPRHSWMMIHEVQSIAMGRASDFREVADRMDVLNDEIVSIYANRWKDDEDALRTALNAETWLTAEAAFEAGLTDSVTDAMAEAARFDPAKFKFANVPKEVLDMATARPRLREHAEAVDSIKEILKGVA